MIFFLIFKEISSLPIYRITAMETYSVLLLILLLNGSFGDENGNSKAYSDVTTTTISTTWHPLVEILIRPLIRKEPNTICIEDVVQCLHPLPNMIELQEQKIINIKDQEIAKKDQELAKKDEKIEKLSKSASNAKTYYDLAAYYRCAINYRRNIENAVDIIIEHPKEANLEERNLIHRKIQEERSRRRKYLGEIVTKLGQLATLYIKVSKSNTGRSKIAVTSVEPIESKSTPKLIPAIPNKRTKYNKMTTVNKKTIPTSFSQGKMTSTTLTCMEKSTTVKTETISHIKKSFRSQIIKLIEMKIVGTPSKETTSFLLTELHWLSQQGKYSDKIWRRWQKNVLIWDQHYRVNWKTNALSAPEITVYSNSLERTLMHENGGLLDEWGVFRDSFRNYAFMYENQTRKAPVSDLVMKCLWILYVEKDTFLHNTVKILLKESPKNSSNKFKELQKKSKHNDMLYYEVCNDALIIYNKLSDNVLHSYQSHVKLDTNECPLSSPQFDSFLMNINPDNPNVVRISLVFNRIFSSYKLLSYTEKVNVPTDKPKS